MRDITVVSKEINGKQYRLAAPFRLKKEAMANARTARKGGWNARVEKSGNGYKVWTRKRLR